MTQHALVYSVEFQWLVLVGWDSLIINITKYYENNKITNRIRSSSQHRLRRVHELLRRQLRITSQGRWLQSSRACLDKLDANAHLHRWTVRQPHTHQRQGRQNTPPNPTCVTNNARYTKRGLYIPLFVARGCSFPLATKLSTNHYEIQNRNHRTNYFCKYC